MIMKSFMQWSAVHVQKVSCLQQEDLGPLELKLGVLATSLCEYAHRKKPKNSDTENIVVIVLKFEQRGFTIEKCVQKM